MNSTGKLIRQKQLGPFQLVEKYYSPGTTLPRHEHASEYVSFLLTGCYDEIALKEQRSCPPGTVIWHPHGEVHTDQFHIAGAVVLDMEIDRVWLDEATQELKLFPGARMCRGGLAYSLGLQLYRALADRDPGVEDVAIELLSLFFSSVVDRRPPVWFHRALGLAAVVDEERRSLTSLAREFGVHPVHLAHSFRRFLGCTFSDYVTKLQIRRALELLLIENQAIVDVAYACGFADHAHLSRTFKKVTGLTPRAFRLRARGDAEHTSSIEFAKVNSVQAFECDDCYSNSGTDFARSGDCQ